MFLPQVPYMPLGDLRAVVSYPAEPRSSDAASARVLEQVTLGHLVARLDEDEDEWAKVLSPGEQQRIAFARVSADSSPGRCSSTRRPQHSTKARSSRLHSCCAPSCPTRIVVSISHRTAVGQHHNRQFELLGGGPWRLQPNL